MTRVAPRSDVTSSTFPEDLRGAPAGIVSRASAAVVDLAVAVAMLVGIYAGFAAVRFLVAPRSFTFPAPSLALVIVVGGVVTGVYFAVCWTISGRTYGAFLLGLRAVGRHGRHPGVVLAVLRALACVVFPIGLLWVAVDRRNRSLQDLLLRTSVIYDWPAD